MANPYRDLFIYYLEGCMNSDPPFCGDAFLGNWQEDGFSFLFFSEPAEAKVAKILDHHGDLTLIDKYHMTYEEWQGGKVSCLRAGRFHIFPPWETPGSQGDSLDIALDPGVVFGTGTHPTTRHCLEALDLLFEKEEIDSALDLGTGTGVLALAAARNGCRWNLAVDKNLLAVRTARRNVRLNRLEDHILVIQGLAEDWLDNPADLLIANIHYDIMRNLIDFDGFYDKKWFILSGLLRSQAREILRLLSNRPIEIQNRWEHEGIWSTFLGRVRHSH